MPREEFERIKRRAEVAAWIPWPDLPTPEARTTLRDAPKLIARIEELEAQLQRATTEAAAS